MIDNLICLLAGFIIGIQVAPWMLKPDTPSKPKPEKPEGT